MKSIRSIAVLGIAAVLLVMFSMMVTLQTNPKIKALLELSDNLRVVFALQEVTVNKRPPNGLRVDFYTREPLLPREIGPTMQAIGLYVWNYYRSKKALANVNIVYHRKTSGQQQTIAAEIARPAPQFSGK